MNVTLSVLIPTFNHGVYLPTAVEAILAQSRPPDELIILDDCSTDGTNDVVSDLAHRNRRIQHLRNAVNLGAIRSMNRLLGLASGDYVFFAAADDRVLPGLFEDSLSLLTRCGHAGLCSSLSTVIDERGAERGIFPTVK